MPGITDTQGASPHRVALIVRGRIGEGVAGNGLIKQGLLVERTSAGKYVPHATAGGSGEGIIALEEGLLGYPYSVDDAYAADSIFPLLHMLPGDVVYGRLPAAAVAVADNSILVSNGDGTVVLGTAESSSLLYSNSAASAAISNVATITAFDKSYTIPANFLRVGDVIHVKAQGIATATNGSDTLVITLKIGSTTVVATSAADAVDNDQFRIEGDFIIRSIGGSGTFVASGETNYGAAGTSTDRSFRLASTAIDTTAAQAITVSATWSAASSSNSVRLDHLTVELLRGATGRMLFKAMEAVDNSLGATTAGIKMRYVG